MSVVRAKIQNLNAMQKPKNQYKRTTKKHMIRGPAPGRRTRSDSWERMPNPTKKEIAAPLIQWCCTGERSHPSWALPP